MSTVIKTNGTRLQTHSFPHEAFQFERENKIFEKTIRSSALFPDHCCPRVLARGFLLLKSSKKLSRTQLKVFARHIPYYKQNCFDFALF